METGGDGGRAGDSEQKRCFANKDMDTSAKTLSSTLAFTSLGSGGQQMMLLTLNPKIRLPWRQEFIHQRKLSAAKS